MAFHCGGGLAGALQIYPIEQVANVESHHLAIDHLGKLRQAAFFHHDQVLVRQGCVGMPRHGHQLFGVNLKLRWMRSKSERITASSRLRLAAGPSTLMVTQRSWGSALTRARSPSKCKITPVRQRSWCSLSTWVRTIKRGSSPSGKIGYS